MFDAHGVLFGHAFGAMAEERQVGTRPYAFASEQKNGLPIYLIRRQGADTGARAFFRLPF